MRRTTALLAALAAGLVTTSCSTDASTSAPTQPDGATGGGLFATMLDLVPETVASETGGIGTISIGDLDVAGDLGGVRRPPTGRSPDPDDVRAWLGPLTGLPQEAPVNASLFPPQVVQISRTGQVDDFYAELGWSIANVHRYVEMGVTPNQFTAMVVDSTATELTAALGDPRDDVWAVGGDDGTIDLDDRSAARPSGEPLRMALRDGVLAISRATPPVVGWLAGREDAPTLADRPALAALAAAFDRFGAYAGLFSEAQVLTPDVLGNDATAADLAALVADTPLPTFDWVGVGLGATEDGAAVGYYVYHQADPTIAGANVDIITKLFEDGSSVRGAGELQRYVDVQSVERVGAVVIATVSFGDTDPRFVWNSYYARELITISA